MSPSRKEPSTEPVGVALIGTGMWARRLAGALARSRLHVVSCFSRHAEGRRAFVAEFGYEAADSFEQAVTHPQARGVILATPNDVHAGQTAACAAAGRHVFVEKPMAYSLAEAAQMDDACRRAGVSLLVGHCFRRLGAARRAKALLEEGRLGEVVLAEANFSLPGRLTPDKWRYYRETCPGGPLMQLGIHHADTLHYWLGKVDSVQGSFARVATSAEIDDVGTAVMEFSRGARGVLTGSYVSPATFFLRVYGSQANLEYVVDMSVWPQAERIDEFTTLTLRTPQGSEPVSFAPRDMVVEELDEFAACIAGEATPETGAAEGTAALAVILAAIESHTSGRPVSL